MSYGKPHTYKVQLDAALAKIDELTKPVVEKTIPLGHAVRMAENPVTQPVGIQDMLA
jgi:hypothetical protein